MVSTNEHYALAWGIFSQALGMSTSGTNSYLTWPAYPAGFALATAASLDSPIAWTTNNIPPPAFSNGQNVVWLSPTNGAQFFRLQTPNF